MGNQKTDSKSFEEFCEMDEDEQYTEKELEVAKSCVALIKVSRGTINVTLKSIDCVGDIAEQVDGDKQKALFKWIGTIHDLVRTVGEDMTDLGTLLYPTLSLDDIETQANKQAEAVSKAINFVLDASVEGSDAIEMSEEVTEMAHKLKSVAQTRKSEIEAALNAARN